MENSRKGLGIWKYRASHLRVATYAVALATLLAAAGLWSFSAFLFNKNFHAVIKNEVYRSAQPSPAALNHWIREFGLRSVINLRGGEGEKACFKAERAVTEAHRVDFHFIRVSASSAALLQLVHILDNAQRPLLLHCARGIERGGIASAMALLLAGENVAQARKQFSLNYGFIPWLHRSDLPKVLDDYKQWLALRGWSHTPNRFRYWVENDYVPYFYRAHLEPLDVPTSIARGNRALLRFRATNTSPLTWRFRSEHDRGVHLGAKVRLLKPNVVHEIELRGGLYDLSVAPGDAVVLEIEVPPLLEYGRYQFFVDLVDEHVVWFSAMGSEPVIFELNIEASDPSMGKRLQSLRDSDGAM